MQEPADRDRIAQVGVANALLLDVVLARLRQQAGIAVRHDGRAGLAQLLREPDRRTRSIDPDPLAGKRRQSRLERRAVLPPTPRCRATHASDPAVSPDQ